jgi:uncharacterized ParB-like nuclease family protein
MPKAKPQLESERKLVTAPPPQTLPEAAYAEITVEGDLSDAKALNRNTRATIQELTDLLDEYDVQIEDLKQRRADVADLLGSVLDENKIKTLSFGDVEVGYTHSRSTFLDKSLLLANRVPASVLEASYRSKPYRYFFYTNKTREAAKRAAKREASTPDE